MVLCCKCGEYGYVGHGTVDSIYRPKFRKGYIDTVYIVQPNKKVIYGRYVKFYIRHPYSSERYHKDMIRYRNHEIRSRPNGQKRCYLRIRTFYSGRTGVAFSRYDYPERDPYRRRFVPRNRLMEKLWRGKTVLGLSTPQKSVLSPIASN